MNFKSIVLVSAGFLLCSTSFAENPNVEKDSVMQNLETEKIIVNKKDASPFNNGKFEGWGTSFCWWPNRIGYDDELAQKAAKAFYSPEGLGFNIIRYNIGGGDDPSHHHITRTDSDVPGYLYLDENGNPYYDWSADHNQRNVLKEALKVGQNVIVEAFSNSPPYFMTNSGCSSGAVDSSKNNLRDDQYEAFAEYMATVIEHYKNEEGIVFSSCDPMNEPATSYWGANSWKQEGCHFDMGESQSRMLLEMKKALERHNLNDVILCGTDETDIDVAAFAYKQLSKEAKKSISRIDAHTYGGVDREALKNLAKKEKKNLWMSEVDGGYEAGENAGEMSCPLWLANRIVLDMNGMQPSAWIMWQAIDCHISKEGRNGNKDWAPSNFNGGYWGLAVCNHDTKEIILTKKYYTMAQFSRYIKPGATIIASSDHSLAAYDKDKKQLVIVVVNDKAKDRNCQIDLSCFKKLGEKATVIRTSNNPGEDCAEIAPLNIVEKTLNAFLLGNSVTTYVVDNVL